MSKWRRVRPDEELQVGMVWTDGEYPTEYDEAWPVDDMELWERQLARARQTSSFTYWTLGDEHVANQTTILESRVADLEKRVVALEGRHYD